MSARETLSAETRDSQLRDRDETFWVRDETETLQLQWPWPRRKPLSSTNMDIQDSNVKEDDLILTVFGTSIPDTTCHQKIIQIPTSPKVFFSALPAKKQNKRNIHWNERKTSINFISQDLWPPTALTSVHSLTMFAVSCSSESIGRCLGMSMKSRSDWLKSGAEHYRHCYQRMEKASACIFVRTKGRYFEYLQLAVGQLDKLSAKVTEIWTKCALSVLF